MLDELLEEYKEVNEEDKKVIIDKFTEMLWSSKYTYKKRKRYYKYKVNKESLNHRDDLISLFDQYKAIEFTFCKSYYKKSMEYIDYIRIHVNNMYGFLTDTTVYLPKEYYQLLLTPKREYYKSVERLKNGENVDYDKVKNTIVSSLSKAEEIKNESSQRKVKIKWDDYKELVNSYIERIFNNYIPPHEYEKEHGWEMKVHVDGWSENNYVIKYFCKSLTGYIRNYIRDSKLKEEIKSTYCKNCGIIINVRNKNTKYCKDCLEMITKRRRKINNKKYYIKNK